MTRGEIKMRTLYLLLLLSVTTWAEPEGLSAEDQVRVVNAAAGWRASLDWVQGRDVQKLLTPKILKKRKIYEKSWGHLASRVHLPDRFDTKTVYPECISPVHTRIGCETAWEVVAVEVLSDRLCIYTAGNYTDRFSLSYLLACSPYSKNCSGGDLPNTWTFLEEHGLPLESCVPAVPYKASCPFVCQDLSPLKKFVIRDPLSEASVVNIQMDLLNNGPVGGVVKVYEDFLYYKSGIYTHIVGKELGETMLRILAWDVQNGVKYWLCANNWGTDWGENGYIRIAFGQLGIEANAMTIIPTLL